MDVCVVYKTSLLEVVDEHIQNANTNMDVCVVYTTSQIYLVFAIAIS